jgi:hypothetical protein
MALPRFFWPTMLGLTAVVAALFLMGPLAGMFKAGSVSLNEGYNAYFEQQVANGVPLYGTPPKLVNDFYPPLSFHFMGPLGRLAGDINQTGRWVALISLLLVALLCGEIVRYFTSSLPLAVYTALSVLIWLGVYRSDRIGMNDSQLFGSVFSLLGLYLYIRFSGSLFWLSVSALAFTVSVFIKHSLLAFPAAVALLMLLDRNWKGFLVWGAVVALFSALLLVFAVKVDGPYFFASMTLRRVQIAWITRITEYALAFQVPIILALLWSLNHIGKSAVRILVVALATAHLVAFAFAGGDGIDRNVYFDSMFVLIMIGALAFAEFAPLFNSWNLRWLALAGLLILPSTGILIQAPFELRYALLKMKHLPSRDSSFKAAVQFVQQRPGTAMCEEMLVCFAAGKPLLYEPFTVSSGIKTGRLKEQEIMALFETHSFSVVQLQSAVLDYPQMASFTPKVLEAILTNYRLVYRNDTSALFEPKL